MRLHKDLKPIVQFFQFSTTVAHHHSIFYDSLQYLFAEVDFRNSKLWKENA